MLLNNNKSPITTSMSLKNSTDSNTNISIDDIISKPSSNPSSEPYLANSFNDYNPVYSDANTPIVSTKTGFLGMNTAKNTIYMTTYNGTVAWKADLVNNFVVKEYYKSVGINDISNYSVKSWINSNDRYLFVLFSDANKKNSIVFALDITTGYILFFDTVQTTVIPVYDGATVLFNASSPKTIFVLSDGTGAQVRKKLVKIFLNDSGISSITLSNNRFSINDDDVFIGFMNGHLNDNWNMPIFTRKLSEDEAKQKGEEIYGTVLDDNLQHFYNKSGIEKVEFKAKWGWSDFNGIKNERDIPKHHFTLNPLFFNGKRILIFVSYAKFSYISIAEMVPVTKKTGNQFKYKYNFLSQFTFGNIDESDLFRVSISELNKKIFYSTDYSKHKPLGVIGMFDFYDLTLNHNFYVVNGPVSHYTPPDFVPVQTSNNDGFFLVSSKTQGSNNRNQNNQVHMLKAKKNENESSIIKELEFNSFQDPNTQYNLEWSKKNFASKINEKEITDKLHFKNNKDDNQKKVESKLSDDEAGVFASYLTVSEKNIWDKSRTSTKIKIPIYFTGFYSTDKFGLRFVTSSDVNEEKFKKILDFKLAKKPSEITKQEIKDNFIDGKILGIDDSQITINDSWITTTSNDKSGSLTITITVAKTNLPFSEKDLILKETFYGFRSDGSYSHEFVNKIPNNFQNRLPSSITLDDVLNHLVLLSNNYSKNNNSWEYELQPNDDEGTLTINKLIYTNTSDPNITTADKEIVKSNPKTFNGFLNIPDKILTSNDISFDNISEEEIVGKKLLDLWNEYETVKNSDDESILNQSLIYRTMNNGVTVNKKDVKLELENKENLEIDKHFKYKITIVDNAVLTTIINGSNVVFDQQLKTKFETKKDLYPFKVKQNIGPYESFIDIKHEVIENNAFEINEGKDTIRFNLKKANFNEINKNFTLDKFSSKVESVKNEIINLFDFSRDYNPVVSQPLYDFKNLSVTFLIDFNHGLPSLRKPDHDNNIISKKFVITGFTNSSQLTSFEIVLIVIIICLLIIIVFVILTIKLISKKKKSIQNSNLKKS